MIDQNKGSLLGLTRSRKNNSKTKHFPKPPPKKTQKHNKKRPCQKHSSPSRQLNQLKVAQGEMRQVKPGSRKHTEALRGQITDF